MRIIYEISHLILIYFPYSNFLLKWYYYWDWMQNSLIHFRRKISEISSQEVCNRKKTEFNSKNLKVPAFLPTSVTFTKLSSISAPWCLSSVKYCTKLSLRFLPVLHIYDYQYSSKIQVVFILEIVTDKKIAFYNGKG